MGQRLGSRSARCLDTSKLYNLFFFITFRFKLSLLFYFIHFEQNPTFIAEKGKQFKGERLGEIRNHAMLKMVSRLIHG